MDNKTLLQLSSKNIKRLANECGFDACGLALVEQVPIEVSNHYNLWLKNGQHAEMNYLTRNNDIRFNPEGLLPGAKTIISVALNYYPKVKLRDDQYQLAWYAYGQDYHEVMRDKLTELSKRVINSIDSQEEIKFRVCCDTAPILERYWAYKSGLGWIGKNTQLIIPGKGSCFFLGEILITLKADAYDSPVPNQCGHCQRCIEACPGRAIDPHNGLSAAKCLSYLTIEHRGNFEGSESLKKANTIYGCDVCQKVCPWNKFATPNKTPELQPKKEFLEMKPENWIDLTIEEYRKLFKGSAVKRAKYSGLMRNINKRKE